MEAVAAGITRDKAAIRRNDEDVVTASLGRRT